MIKGIIFDMDDTLYTSDSLRNSYREAAIAYLAAMKGISMDDAAALHQRVRESIEKEFLYTPTNWMILSTIGVSWDDWVKQSVDHVKPNKFLKPDQKLLNVLKSLKNDFRLGILTNNNRIQTERILDALDIRELFHAILTVSDTGISKPNPILCEKIARYLGCSPEECLMIGDNPGIDLEPAAQVGMSTLHVRHVEEIYSIDKNIIILMQ